MVYAYIRVSTDKQDGANQKIGIESLCRKKNLHIDRYVDDEGVSGTKEPGKRKLGDLLRELKEGDVIIASEISRLGRNLFMIMRILEECMNKGVKLYTVKDGYELGDNIASKVLAFAFGLSAEIERNLISQRTKEALARKKAEGVVLGRPIGKRSAKVKLTGREKEIKVLLMAKIPKIQIARKMDVDRNTLYKFLKDNRMI